MQKIFNMKAPKTVCMVRGKKGKTQGVLFLVNSLKWIHIENFTYQYHAHQQRS
jgi:hypothetical protein